jgi:hypothetical protein
MPHVARIISSDSIPAGGFTPGTILADRYRIIGLLGHGGMGEVYRADDLKLGQPVALKFLPAKLAEDPVRRERFFAEVRITRQLSHPNICRAYDIAEIDRRHFLSMEFIDGEDLASLLKRIGHLPYVVRLVHHLYCENSAEKPNSCHCYSRCIFSPVGWARQFMVCRNCIVNLHLTVFMSDTVWPRRLHN